MKTLEIGAETFNHSIDLKKSQLTDLCLGENFNQSVDNLPPTLVDLAFNGILFHFLLL